MSAQPNNIVPLRDSEPKVSVVSVTPEMAQRWLKRNDNNRNLRALTVTQYARDMVNGRWQVTGESIKFNAAGVLLDGQHRLAAIVKAGVTIQLVVMRGIPDAAKRVMDTGRARTASDALTMKGERHSVILAAAARIAIGMEAEDPDPGKYAVTHAEVGDFVENNPGLRYASEFASQVARRTDCPPAVVAYTFWRFAQTADVYTAANFWTAAADKVGLAAGDPVIALTNRFAEARRNRETLPKRVLLSLIYRAWNARREHKTMRFIRVNSPAGGLVPIPEIHP